jgi:hypothetical protein
MAKHNCKILKDGVNDLGLAFAGKIDLGPFWSWVPVLSYRPRTAALRQHLRFHPPARAYVYRRKDLHEDANAGFIC